VQLHDGFEVGVSHDEPIRSYKKGLRLATFGLLNVLVEGCAFLPLRQKKSAKTGHGVFVPDPAGRGRISLACAWRG